MTPQTGVWLAGYGSKRAPDGKLHDLWMKVLALEDDAGHRAVLITSDFQGVPKVMSERVFARIKREYGIERHQVMFTFSHNHCGPRLGDDLVDYALRFKREFGPGTWVCGYSDDMIAYIPSRRVWEEGGYEGGSYLYEYGRPAFR